LDYFISKYDTKTAEGAKRCVLEDSIMQKGHPASAGSKIIENFVSPLDATVVTKLEAAGVVITGKTKMDEFGAAGLFSGSGFSSGAVSADGAGDTSGAVSAVADGIADFALCNDYTGTVGCRAAARSVCYIHPTYGTVSRYGLIHAVPSMDQIGIVCKTPEDGFRILEIISGRDPNDGAMLDAAEQQTYKPQESGFRVGVPVNVLSRVPDTAAITDFTKGHSAVETELRYFDVFPQVMQILCCAELSSNLTRYDGIKFGYRAGGYRDLRELYTKTRTEALGKEVKLASIIGAMVLSQEKYSRYYDKAMRIRRLIAESLEFDRYDAIIMPVADPARNMADNLALSSLARLCGLPAITIPYRGGGITLIADRQREDVLLGLTKCETDTISER